MIRGKRIDSFVHCLLHVLELFCGNLIEQHMRCIPPKIGRGRRDFLSEGNVRVLCRRVYILSVYLCISVMCIGSGSYYQI